MKIITARELIRPATKKKVVTDRNYQAVKTYPARSESRTVQISMSGRWLEALGFQPGAPVYVGIVGDTVTLSANPPEVVELTPLEEIKREYARLGISTTR
jgi:hypothetical protein